MSWKKLFNGIRKKLKREDVIPFHTTIAAHKGRGFHYKGQEYIHYSPLHPHEMAFHRLAGAHIIILYFLLIDFFLALIINWHVTLIIFVALLTILYFADLLFNLFLITQSFWKPAEIVISEQEIKKIPDTGLPAYTVFCPLYKEWQVISQFVTSFIKLDYPQDKLQIMLLLEEDDTETIKKVKEYHLPDYFTIVIVPHSLPKTKPKACNYGLLHATGE